MQSLSVKHGCMIFKISYCVCGIKHPFPIPADPFMDLLMPRQILAEAVSDNFTLRYQFNMCRQVHPDLIYYQWIMSAGEQYSVDRGVLFH